MPPIALFICMAIAGIVLAVFSRSKAALVIGTILFIIGGCGVIFLVM